MKGLNILIGPVQFNSDMFTEQMGHQLILMPYDHWLLIATLSVGFCGSCV